jgi:Short C-terminal domain/Phospholipase_D-nuclease N-terminal
MDFWDIVWFIFISFAFVAYLMVMFTIITDLFRDPETSGWLKAVWIICLIFFPLITALIYLIVRGRSMTARNEQTAQTVREQQERYIRQVATSGSSPADQIAQAKQLLDSGAISQAEFDALKQKALT